MAAPIPDNMATEVEQQQSLTPKHDSAVHATVTTLSGDAPSTPARSTVTVDALVANEDPSLADVTAAVAPVWLTDIRRDPTIQTMLAKMPATVAARFDDEQLQHLRLVLGARQWGKHQIDIRGTFSLWHFRYYLVLVAGRNRRFGQRSGRFNRLLLALLLSILLSGVLVVVFVMLYLIKSALGIDLLPDYSLGLWHWLRSQLLFSP